MCDFPLKLGRLDNIPLWGLGLPKFPLCRRLKGILCSNSILMLSPSTCWVLVVLGWCCMSTSMLGHLCFSCYRTYVMILCNWLILWQNALYLYVGRLRMCFKYFKKPRFKIKSVQEIKQECKFIKARQLVDSFSTPPICRGLRISESNSDFLGIRESVYGSSFLLTLDI